MRCARPRREPLALVEFVPSLGGWPIKEKAPCQNLPAETPPSARRLFQHHRALPEGPGFGARVPYTPRSGPKSHNGQFRVDNLSVGPCSTRRSDLVAAIGLAEDELFDIRRADGWSHSLRQIVQEPHDHFEEIGRSRILVGEDEGA